MSLGCPIPHVTVVKFSRSVTIKGQDTWNQYLFGNPDYYTIFFFLKMFNLKSAQSKCQLSIYKIEQVMHFFVKTVIFSIFLQFQFFMFNIILSKNSYEIC